MTHDETGMARSSLWELIENEYSLSYAEWVHLLREAADDLEQDVTRGKDRA